MQSVGILGSGIYLPSKVVYNQQLEVALSLQPGFIESRTGIKERRWTDTETVVSMAVEASIDAVKDAGITSIDRIFVCRDVILTKRAYSIGLPIIECLKDSGIDVDGAFSIDISNYCPGFIHALHLAEQAVSYDNIENVLVVASTDYKDMVDTTSDFNTLLTEKFRVVESVRQYSLGTEGCFQAPRLNAFLWGCGAGAFVVGRNKEGMICGYSASGSRKIRRDSYGIGETKHGTGFASLDGKAIYQFAIQEVPDFLSWYLKKQNLTWADIDFLIPHQPNPRILAELGKRLNLPKEKVLVSCDTLGNMIAASIPITYHLNKKNGKICQGSRILICSFGDSYLTVAAIIVTG